MKTRALVIIALTTAFPAWPDTASPGQTLAEQIIHRPANEGRIGEMHFTMTDKNGRTRQREAVLVHSDADTSVKIAIHFTAPAAIADTAFLSHDNSGSVDETWLFLPATERVRRLPSSDRGDAFMGTDLSYGDVKDNFKFQLEDWTFSGGDQENEDGLLILSGIAKDQAVRETGYGAFTALVDSNTLFPMEVIYEDADGQLLKKVTVLDQDKIEGAWTAMHFRAENLQTGHQTDIQLKNVRCEPDLDSDLLDPDFLDDGAPD